MSPSSVVVMPAGRAYWNMVETSAARGSRKKLAKVVSPGCSATVWAAPSHVRLLNSVWPGTVWLLDAWSTLPPGA